MIDTRRVFYKGHRKRRSLAGGSKDTCCCASAHTRAINQRADLGSVGYDEYSPATALVVVRNACVILSRLRHHGRPLCLTFLATSEAAFVHELPFVSLWAHRVITDPESVADAHVTSRQDLATPHTENLGYCFRWTYVQESLDLRIEHLIRVMMRTSRNANPTECSFSISLTNAFAVSISTRFSVLPRERPNGHCHQPPSDCASVRSGCYCASSAAMRADSRRRYQRAVRCRTHPDGRGYWRSLAWS